MYADTRFDVQPEMKPIEQWRLDLLKAADEIERRGWCQNTFKCGRKVCLGTAINLVTIGSPHWGSNDPRAKEAFDRMHHACYKDNFIGFVSWQDAPGRTVEEVTAKLREVAAS